MKRRGGGWSVVGRSANVCEVFYHRRRECQARAWSRQVACEEGANVKVSELIELAHAIRVRFCSCKSIDDRGLLGLHVVRLSHHSKHVRSRP